MYVFKNYNNTFTKSRSHILISCLLLVTRIPLSVFAGMSPFIAERLFMVCRIRHSF